MERTIETLEDLSAEADRFVHGLAPGLAGATLVTLSGELGAGKTAFVKAVAHALGVGETVTSPTFVLEKVYQLRKLADTPCPPATGGHGVSAKTFSRLVHIDAYRLENGAALAPLGFDEIMHDQGNLVLLEWPERVADALPPAAVALTFSANPDGSHTISYG